MSKNVKNFSDLIKLIKLKNYVCAIDYLRTSEIKNNKDKTVISDQ